MKFKFECPQIELYCGAAMIFVFPRCLCLHLLYIGRVEYPTKPGIFTNWPFAENSFQSLGYSHQTPLISKAYISPSKASSYLKDATVFSSFNPGYDPLIHCVLLTLLIQEIERFDQLLSIIHKSLKDLHLL